MKASLAVIAALFVSPAYASENAFGNRYPAWLTDKATSWSDVQLTNSPCSPVDFGPVHGTGAPARNQSLFTAPQLLSNVVPPSSSSSGTQTAMDASNSLALQLLSKLASPSSSSSTQTEFVLPEPMSVGPSLVVGNVQGGRCGSSASENSSGMTLASVNSGGGGGTFSGSSSGGGAGSGGVGGTFSGSSSGSGGVSGTFSGSSSGSGGAPKGAGHSDGGIAATFFSNGVSTAASGGSVRGAPGPVAGAGLPVLAVGYGVYWLVRRRRSL